MYVGFVVFRVYANLIMRTIWRKNSALQMSSNEY